MPKGGVYGARVNAPTFQTTIISFDTLISDSEDEEVVLIENTDTHIPVEEEHRPYADTDSQLDTIEEVSRQASMREWNLESTVADIESVFKRTFKPRTASIESETWIPIAPSPVVEKDAISKWSDRVSETFINLQEQSKKPPSKDFQENLGKLSFFRRPIVH